MIGEAPHRECGPVAHGRIAVAHERQQHALRALVGDQVLERRGHRPAHVRGLVLRGARERVDGPRVLLLSQRVDGRLDHLRVGIVEQGYQREQCLVGEGVQLTDDVGAGDALRGVLALAEMDRAVEHLTRADRVQLLDRSPSRIIVLLTDDEREQLVDGMHGPMLP
jgi:hypothetical protein